MEQGGTIQRRLSLGDSTAIIVGIIIGVGFYGTSPFIASCAGGQWQAVGAWAIGGLMALVGASCYAELATAYPRAGGEYVYLSRAFGGFWGFLFAWAGFWVIRPASIGALAIVFGQYALEIAPIGGGHGVMIYALGSILVLTLLNIVGVEAGKWTQNILTAVKVGGLLLIFVVGFASSAPSVPSAASSGGSSNFPLALVLVMWAYGGWNEMATVAAEVRRPERNIMRALLLGTSAVMAIYIIGTIAFFHALGYAGMTGSQRIAADVMRLHFAGWGPGFISALVAVSCLSANNGMIFTSARVYYALGSEHRLYGWLGAWNQRTGTPVRALLAEGVVAVVLTAIIGSTANGFERLVAFTGPLFWFFLLLTGASLIVLRYSDPLTKRAYRVPLYPLTPAVFLAACGYMLYASADYAWGSRGAELWITLGIVVAGVVMGMIDRGAGAAPTRD